MPKTALVIGATGLVGSTLVPLLLASPSYAKVVLLVRRPLPLAHAKLVQSVIDFDQPDASLVQGDDLFCAIGTTLKKAGSQAAQYQIDCTYPHELAKLAQANGCQQFILVSSIGADAQSGNFYLRTKGDLAGPAHGGRAAQVPGRLRRENRQSHDRPGQPGLPGPGDRGIR